MRTMKTIRLVSFTLMALLVVPFSFAAKPEKDKIDKGMKQSESAQARDMKAEHQMKARQAEATAEEAKMKAEKHREQAKETKGQAALEGKKDGQERKELGKGSEQGQAKRAENSRKWWKFWAKDSDPEKKSTD